MDLQRWPAVAPVYAVRAIVVLGVVMIAGCGSSHRVSTSAAAAGVVGIDAAGAGVVPAPDAARVNVDSEVLADELRNAAVQALQLPDPIVQVGASADGGEVLLEVGNTWETVDLKIRSVEQTPTEVVVFASPVRADWQLGDGNELRCNEFGNVDAEGECVHTYPAHGRFEGEIELVWGLSWSLDGEHLGIFETTSTGASFVVDR